MERITDVIAGFTDRTPLAAERPLILAVDGRSSSGKTTLASRIAEAVPATAMVHSWFWPKSW